MFAGNNPSRRTTTKKRGREELNDEGKNYYIDGVMLRLFANVSDSYRESWQANMGLAKQVVILIVNAAENLGIRDHAEIKKIIDIFILSEADHTQLPAHEIYFGLFTWRFAGENIEIFHDRVRTIHQRMQNIQLESLLQSFFRAGTQQIRKEMLNFWMKHPRFETGLEYLHDMTLVHNFLRDKPKVQGYLKQLESALQKLAARRNFPANRNGLFELPQPDLSHESAYARYKLLSSYFYQWAEQNGFSRKVKVTRNLKKNEFFDLLLSRSWIKDSFFDAYATHGVWSHALQWYCVFEYAKAEAAFHHPLIELYQQFGGGARRYRDDFTSMLWIEVFDSYRQDYTSPDFVNASIISDKEEVWPLLAGTLERTQEKMQANISKYGYFKYLQDKHKGEIRNGVVSRRLIA